MSSSPGTGLAESVAGEGFEADYRRAMLYILLAQIAIDMMAENQRQDFRRYRAEMGYAPTGRNPLRSGVRDGFRLVARYLTEELAGRAGPCMGGRTITYTDGVVVSVTSADSRKLGLGWAISARGAGGGVGSCTGGGQPSGAIGVP